METFAVAVFPVAKPDEWRAWADSIASGERAQSEHERYIATYVIPDLHGVDPSAGPPPVMAKVATIDS